MTYLELYTCLQGYIHYEMSGYQYKSVEGALNLLYHNSKNSAKTRQKRGRVEASEHNITKEYLLKLWKLWKLLETVVHSFERCVKRKIKHSTFAQSKAFQVLQNSNVGV